MSGHEDTKISEGFCLLGYKAVKSVESQLTFRRNMSPPFSELKSKKNFSCYMLHAGFFFGLLFNTEDGGDSSFLRNIG
jgi:hypothetical protein